MISPQGCNFQIGGLAYDRNTNKLTSVERLLLSILTKSPREVNEISKYFKITNTNKVDSNKSKLYA